MFCNPSLFPSCDAFCSELCARGKINCIICLRCGDHSDLALPARSENIQVLMFYVWCKSWVEVSLINNILSTSLTAWFMSTTTITGISGLDTTKGHSSNPSEDLTWTHKTSWGIVVILEFLLQQIREKSHINFRVKPYNVSVLDMHCFSWFDPQEWIFVSCFEIIASPAVKWRSISPVNP